MKGKHETSRPGKSKTAALIVIAVGLVMVITALIMEAGHYPWGLLFGTASQSEESLPDPAPLVLDAEDADSEIVFEPEATTEALPAAEPSQEPLENAAESAILPGSEVDTAEAPKPPAYVVLGVFKIPVLSVSQNLLEGSGKQMKYGVGHVTGTAAPGQEGNCAVSGHRPYPFRYLDQLVSGDSVVIKAGDITYTYTVYESFEVLPSEVWVLNSVEDEAYALTIITCTPYMVSSHRLIVRARLTEVNGLTPQGYYGMETPAESTEDSAATDGAATDGAATEAGSIETSSDGTDASPAEGTAVSPEGSAEPSAKTADAESAGSSEGQTAPSEGAATPPAESP